MTKKKRPTFKGPRPVRVGDLVDAWDCHQQLSMDASDDDGHVMGYVRAIADDHIEVTLGGHVVKCWKDPVTVLQRCAARVSYYIAERHISIRHDTPGFGETSETLEKQLEHGPFIGPLTAAQTLRILAEDRLKHSGREFRLIKRGRLLCHFGNPKGPDYEITMEVIPRLKVLYPRRRPTTK